MEYKMEQWKGTKCQFGYINKQKKFQFAMLMLYVLIGVGLFLIGFADIKRGQIYLRYWES